MSLQNKWIGMDLDSETRKMKPGFTRENLNCRLNSSASRNKEAVENIFGNTRISSMEALPAGNNINIGNYEDKKGNSIIYFVYNSNNNHCIYRLYPQSNYAGKLFQSSLLNFSLSSTISHIDLVDNILTWTDGNNPPCKINIFKSFILGEPNIKNFTTNLYFGDGSTAQFLGETLNITIKNTAGTPISHSITTIPTTSYLDALTYIQGNLNTWFGTLTGCPFSASIVNNKFISLTQGTSYAGPPWIVSSATASVHASLFWFSDQNFYTQPYTRQQFDMIKWPPHFPVISTMITDKTVLSNKIRGHAFQFIYRYIYDDNEKSAWSPISLPAIDRYLVGKDMLKTNKNFIALDYSDSGNLFQPVYRNMINKVEVGYREGNTGTWLSIIVLEQYQLTGIYNFYNDSAYSAIDPAETAKLYDAVPQIAGSQELGKGRMFYGDYTEGYDEVPVDTKLNVTITDFAQQKSWKLTGRGIITNVLVNAFGGGPIIINQKIYQDSSADGSIGPDYSNPANCVFGAFGSSTPIATIAKGMQQYCPLGGFTFYLVGTSYFGTTRQNFVGGIFVQDWEIDNIPPGTYILRVASHKVNFGGTYGSMYDLNDQLTYNWQTTSTAVTQFCGGDSINNGIYEIEIVLGSSGGVFDTKGNIPSGCLAKVGTNIYDNLNGGSPGLTLPNNGDTYIGDLTYQDTPNNKTQAGAFGYLVEDENNINTNSKGNMLGANRLEGQEIEFLTPGNGSRYYVNYTDHNGFFYVCMIQNAGGTPANIAFQIKAADGVIIKTYNDSFYLGELTFAPILSNSTFVGGVGQVISLTNQGNFVVLYTTNPAHLATLKTSIVVLAQDNLANNLSGIPIAYARCGRFTITGASGIASIRAYMLAYPGEFVGPTGGRDYDEIIVNNNFYNRLTVAPFQHYSGSSGDFNSTNLFYAGPTFSGSHSTGSPPIPLFPFLIPINNFAVSALKRGGTYQYGLVYYDRGNRSTAVCTNDSNKFYIPFFSEDLNKYLPITYPTPSTFKFGQPIINWEIHHPGPSWATHYQWVRILDGYYAQYLQFEIASAEYVEYRKPDGTLVTSSFGNSNVREVYLDLLGTLSLFAGQNSGSSIGYSWTKGDRLRLIIKPTGEYFTTFFDVEITGVYGNKVVIAYDTTMPQLSQGSLIEVYTPNVVPATGSNKVFYEIGEVYSIINGNHQGQSGNQSGATPATGTFTHGDTYFRQRIVQTLDTTNSNKSVTYNYFIEDPNISDFYKSAVQDIGRVNVINKYFKQTRYYADMRFGNVYVDGTPQNGLCEFEQLNHQSMPNRALGAITSLILVNYVMLVLQEHGESSVYIQSNVVLNADGASIIAISDKVINNINPLKGGYGCQHPDTIQEKEGRIYYFSAYAGCVIRYSNDGCTPISDYGTSLFWSQQGYNFSEDTATYLGVNFASLVDPYFNEYILTATWYTIQIIIIGGFPTPIFVPGGFTIAFQEDTNTWTTFYSYQPEKMCPLGVNFYSFLNAIPWKHNTNALRNNFFGIQYDQKFVPVFSQPAEDIKILQSIWIQSNKKWNIPTIILPPDELNPNGMQSELLNTDFKTVEGTHRATFLRNINTPNIANPLLRGDSLRGSSVELHMENTETDEVVLHGINVNYKDSFLLKKS